MLHVEIKINNVSRIHGIKSIDFQKKCYIQTNTYSNWDNFYTLNLLHDAEINEPYGNYENYELQAILLLIIVCN